LRIAVTAFLVTASAFAARADGPETAPSVGGYAWSGWASRGGIAVSGPDCASAAAGRIDCFVRGRDGQLWRLAFDGAAWGPWARAAGVANASLYAARPECVAIAGRVDCFVRRHGDGSLFRRTWAGGYVHSWEALGGSLASDPDCVAQPPARIDCFARGQDGAMWHNAFDGDAWRGWVSRGGTIIEGSKPACALLEANKITCVAVDEEKRLKAFALHEASDGWQELEADAAALPSAENATASPICVGAPDDSRVDCFVPTTSEDRRRSLTHLRYDGSWMVADLGSDFGRATAGANRDLAHYAFDCVVRANDRFDCMELAVWRDVGTSEKSVRFRHYPFAAGGAPAQWREVPLTLPVESGNVTFVKCLTTDGERIDCFTGGSWHGNATLNQASFAYRENIVYRPMEPVD
jgi:hypothetical protein